MSRKQRAADERTKLAAKRRRERQELLGSIISDLRRAIGKRSLDRPAVGDACRALENVNENYRYDDGAFPQLTDTHQFVMNVGCTPANLAEAMLWKLGRWKAYKKFAANYKDPRAEPTSTAKLTASKSRENAGDPCGASAAAAPAASKNGCPDNEHCFTRSCRSFNSSSGTSFRLVTCWCSR
jgi:hypothetical protein